MNTSEKPLVLGIDEMPIMIDIMKNAIVDEYRIKVATSGKSAMAAATCEPIPDCILLDVMMPDIDGYTVCRDLRTHDVSRSTPILMVTSKHSKKAEEESFEAGSDDFIVKPIEPDVIKERIKFHLRKKSQAISNETPDSCTTTDNAFEKLSQLINSQEVSSQKSMQELTEAVNQIQSSPANSAWIAQLTGILRAFTTSLSESFSGDCSREMQELLTSITALDGFDQQRSLSTHYDNASPKERTRIMAEFVLDALQNPQNLKKSISTENQAKNLVSRVSYIRNNPDPEAERPRSCNDVEYRSMSLPLDRIKPTMVLKRAIYCISGTTLLPAGATVTPQIINRLFRAAKNGNGVIEPISLWVPIRRKNYDS